MASSKFPAPDSEVNMPLGHTQEEKTRAEQAIRLGHTG